MTLDLDAIRARHYAQDPDPDIGVTCAWCADVWPCDTALALAEVDRLTAQDHKWAATLARGLERDRIRAAVEGLPTWECNCYPEDSVTSDTPMALDRAAVLAAIDGETT